MKEEFGPRCILVLRQQDDLPIRLPGEFVFGPLSQVDWKELEATAIRISRASTTILGLPEESLVIDGFSGLSTPYSPVGIAILAAPREAGDLALERAPEIRAVAQAYLTGLQLSAWEEQGNLLDPVAKLSPAIEAKVREQVHTDRAVFGGKAIKTAMVLEMGEEKLVLSGTYAPKPVLPRTPPERFVIIGKVGGLSSCRKRLEILSDATIPKEVECDPNRFAHRLRDAIHTPRVFVFRVLRSTDAKGREQLVLTDVEEIEPPAEPESLI